MQPQEDSTRRPLDYQPDPVEYLENCRIVNWNRSGWSIVVVPFKDGRLDGLVLNQLAMAVHIGQENAFVLDRVGD